MLPGLGGEGAFAAVEIEKPDVVRFHGASEVRMSCQRLPEILLGFEIMM